MSYFLLFLYLILIIYFIFRGNFFQSASFPQYIPATVFILKFFAGFCVYIVYAKYYGTRASSDIFKYFDDGNIIYSSIFYNPWDYLRMVTGIDSEASHLDKYYHTCCFWVKKFNYGLINDNRIVIRFNAIVRLISMGNIHIHTLFMSFISFTGLWGIFKIFEQRFRAQKWLLLFSIFFIPSIYFWSSGILKEGILMFAFGMLLYHIYRLRFKHKIIWSLIWIVSTVFILLISKFYVLVAALPGIIFIIWIHLTNKKYFWVKLVAVISLFFVFSWFSQPILGVSFPEIIARKQNDFINLLNSYSQVGSGIDIPVLKPTLKSILLNSPGAFFRSLLRPTVFEVNNAMSLLAAIENLLILLGILITLRFFSTKNLKDSWVWFSILFIVILFTLIGLTTPVLGALVRYKTPALPFLGILILYMIDFESIKRVKLRILKK